MRRCGLIIISVIKENPKKGGGYAEVCFLFVRHRIVISLRNSAPGWIGNVFPSVFAISNSIIPTPIEDASNKECSCLYHIDY